MKQKYIDFFKKCDETYSRQKNWKYFEERKAVRGDYRRSTNWKDRIITKGIKE